MTDNNNYFAPARKSCRHHCNLDLLPAASDFIQSDLYSSKVKVLFGAREIIHSEADACRVSWGKV